MLERAKNHQPTEAQAEDLSSYLHPAGNSEKLSSAAAFLRSANNREKKGASGLDVLIDLGVAAKYLSAVPGKEETSLAIRARIVDIYLKRNDPETARTFLNEIENDAVRIDAPIEFKMKLAIKRVDLLLEKKHFSQAREYIEGLFPIIYHTTKMDPAIVVGMTSRYIRAVQSGKQAKELSSQEESTKIATCYDQAEPLIPAQDEAAFRSLPKEDRMAVLNTIHSKGCYHRALAKANSRTSQ